MFILPDFIFRFFARKKEPSLSVDLEKNQRNDRVVSSGDLSTITNPSRNPTIRSYRLLPIFSGIMIPFSVMLSIPSLTGPWYVRTGEDNVLLETRPNTPLLNAAMALSMVCGIIASTCLVIRFAERKVKLMTMLCVIFLTLHDLINIPAVTIFGVIHRFNDGFTYGQGFWFTVCSTIASTATNVTLVIDYYKTKNFPHAGSGLTHKQRSLVIIIIILLGYLSLGSFILAFMLKMAFIDALYLSVVTIETIGFGDLHPDSTGSRIFMCFYAAGGILNLALAVALSRDALLEAALIDFRARLKAAKARQREKHLLSRWRAAIRWRLRAKGCPVWITDVNDEPLGPRNSEKSGKGWCSSLLLLWRQVSNQVWREWEDPTWRFVYGKGNRRLNLGALTQSQLETAALEAGAPLSELVPQMLMPKRRPQKVPADQHEITKLKDLPATTNSSPKSWPTVQPKDLPSAPSLTHMRLGGMISLIGKFALAVTHEFQPESQQNSNQVEDDGEETVVGHESPAPPTRSERGVPLITTLTMTTMQDDEIPLNESLEMEERIAMRLRLGIAVVLFIIFWMAGAAIFMKTEEWAFGSAVYFCFITFTSVGYGDFAPKTPAGRSIFVAWALAGVGAMTILVSIVADASSTQYKSIIKSEFLQLSSNPVSPLQNGQRRLSLGAESQLKLTSRASLSSASSPTRVGRSHPIRAASMPELQLLPSMAKDSLSSTRRNEKLEELPRQVLEYTEALRSLLSTAQFPASSEDEQCLKTGLELCRDGIEIERAALSRLQIESSLKRIVDAAKDALDQRTPYDIRPSRPQYIL